MAETVTLQEAQEHLGDLIAKLGPDDEFVITQAEDPSPNSWDQPLPSSSRGSLGVQKANSSCIRKTMNTTNLPFHHRDPFDRLIISQAIVEGIPVVVEDRLFDLYPIQRL
ncbi:MAG TPA: hypothetical protein VGK48_10450 [Terriglobia bacterium]|jgi:hypothetical protein